MSKINKNARESWWDEINPIQRRHLLRSAGASVAQMDVLRSREWYQLSKWIRKSISKLPEYKLAVPIVKGA